MKTILRSAFLLICSILAFASCEKAPENNVVESHFRVIDLIESEIFEPGEVKKWTIDSKNVEQIRVKMPKGWAAACNETQLKVIAPATFPETVEVAGDVEISYVLLSNNTKQSVSFFVEVNKPNTDPGLQPGEGPSFELKIGEVTSTTAELFVTPSDPNLGFYFDVCTAQRFEDFNQNVGVMVEGIIDDFVKTHPGATVESVLEVMLEKGETSDVVQRLPAETEMCFFCSYMDSKGNSVGQTAYMLFTTKAPGKPEDCTFEITIEDLRATKATVKVVPSDPSIRYWTSIEEVSKWPGDAAIPAMVEAQLHEYANQNKKPIAEVVKGVTFAGEHTDPWKDGITPNTAYYAYCYAMDNNGHIAGPMFKKQFKTAAYDVSEATVQLAYRYFDGDALYAHDSAKYPNAKGRVLVQVKANPNAMAESWIVALAKGDLTDPVTYPDESTKNAIIQAGQRNKKLQQFWVDGYKTCTLFSCAFDAYGIDGMLNRELLNLTKEGAADLKELAPINATTSKLARIQPVKDESKVFRSIESRMK